MAGTKQNQHCVSEANLMQNIIKTDVFVLQDNQISEQFLPIYHDMAQNKIFEVTILKLQWSIK